MKNHELEFVIVRMRDSMGSGSYGIVPVACSTTRCGHICGVGGKVSLRTGYGASTSPKRLVYMFVIVFLNSNKYKFEF